MLVVLHRQQTIFLETLVQTPYFQASHLLAVDLVLVKPQMVVTAALVEEEVETSVVVVVLETHHLQALPKETMVEFRFL